MYLILVIGMTGQGKSKYVKDLLGDKPAFVFDVQGEYNRLHIVRGQALATHANNPHEYKGPPLGNKNTHARVTDMNEKLFIADAKKKLKTNIVFEEATGFFQGRIKTDFKQLL